MFGGYYEISNDCALALICGMDISAHGQDRAAERRQARGEGTDV